MNCAELITEISKVPERKKKLKRQDDFLIMFAKNPPLSVYQIFNNHKCVHNLKYSRRLKVIIKKLLNFKLIEKVENKISKHGAIDYRLSTGGLYYLIYNKRREFIGLFKKVLHYYDQNIIFKTLLYPYLQKSSLEDIIDTALISKVCAYLQECCEEIQSVLESIEKSNSKYVVQQVCLWNDVDERGKDNDRLIDFLRCEFDINWLDNGAEIIKYGNKSTVRISKRTNRILIALNESKTEATMTMNGKELHKFIVSPRLEILYQGQTIRDWSTFFFLKRVELFAAGLVIALVLSATIESDLKVLSQDEKFMQVLKESEMKFQDKYQKLVEFVTST